MDSSKKNDSSDDLNKPDEPHESIGADEQRLVDETIGMLERESSAEVSQSQPQSKKDICLIGEAVRTSATADLPESNGDLRELLIARLESESSNQSENTEPAVLAKAPSAVSTDKSSWRSFAAIAATVLAISGIGYLLSTERVRYEAPFAVNDAEVVERSNAADAANSNDRSDSKYQSRGPADGSSEGFGNVSADQSRKGLSLDIPTPDAVKKPEEAKPYADNLSLLVDNSDSMSDPYGESLGSAGSSTFDSKLTQQTRKPQESLRKNKPKPPSNSSSGSSGEEVFGDSERQGSNTNASSNIVPPTPATPDLPSIANGKASESGNSVGLPNPSVKSSAGDKSGPTGQQGGQNGRPAEYLSGGEVPLQNGPGNNGQGLARRGSGGREYGSELATLEGKRDLSRYRNFHRPQYNYDSEQYAKINDNPFRKAIGVDAVSTFSIDVDTASYANVRRFINNGGDVPPDAVRIEEMVNYFNYKYEQPTDDKPFSVNMEMATCPWNEQHKLLRVGLKGKEVHQEDRPVSNIVFLLDVSGSMKSNDKLPLLKSGVQMMVNQLNENDRVSIVTYAGNAGVVLEPTPGNQKQKILDAIRNLNAAGSTNGSAGIELAYQLAQKNFVAEGTNKVLLATDGDLNVGVTSDEALVDLITGKAKEGVFLTVLGFGTGNLKDSKLEKLADKGNGIYAYIDGVREAHKVLVEGMSGTLVTIAKDVKIQIEFNPSEVKSYRLIGYENRILAREDFDNDAKDAGEIGAGHTVTALYELVTTDVPTQEQIIATGLKYQKPAEPADQEGDSGVENGELLTLALRFKKPDADKSERIEFTLQNENKPFSTASKDFKFASSVAAFGMILRSSPHRGEANLNWVTETAEASTGADLSGYRKEFIDLVRRKNRAH